MYLVLIAQVSIGQITFDAISNCEVKSSWKELTDIASIELPKNLKFENELVRDHIKRGDKVVIRLGVNNDLKREFVGFVREVEGNIPIKIHCEDYSYLLKTQNKNKSFQNASLKDVVSYITEGTNIQYQAINIQLGKFSIEQTNGAKVLEYIKENYGLVSYFRHNANDESSPVLYVGFPYDFKAQNNNTIFNLQTNVEPKHDLKYKSEDDVKVRIKAISNLSSGKKLIVEVGEKGDDVSVQTRNYPELSKAELTKYANEELRKVKQNGYRGGFTSFGIPRVDHGDTITLLDDEYPDRKGNYLVDEINIRFTDTIYRRKIEIGQKVG